MLSRFEEEIRERLTELERRLAVLEGGNDPRSARGRLSPLSEAERRIVGLVVAGRTDDEVAQRLLLSPETVEWTLTKIYRKLRVRSRTELVAKLGPGAPPSEESAETPGRHPGADGSHDEAGDPLRFGPPPSGSQSEAQHEDGGNTS
jgi:DNA-binding CsgD family transcriptional regulator